MKELKKQLLKLDVTFDKQLFLTLKLSMVQSSTMQKKQSQISKKSSEGSGGGFNKKDFQSNQKRWDTILKTDEK